MEHHELVTPSDPVEWRAYHDIRRRVLFEARGQIGVYDEHRPDERAPGHHSKLLLYRGDPVGVVRIDIDATTAICRRVAVRSDVQRLGHGRALLRLAQRFAQESGCVRLVSFVAADAVEFYQRCGFTIGHDIAGPAGHEPVYMTKPLDETHRDAVTLRPVSPESRPGRKEADVTATLEKAWGYQGNTMQLPVRDLAAALPFYETVLGFRVVSRSAAPHNAAVLARDGVQIGLAENGGDPTQDGCAFHVKDLASLFAEFNANGLHKERSEFDVEQHDGVAWKVFYVVAPDGLCYWFGERQTG